MSADLHLHTYYSDGLWSPEELIEEAIRLDFDTIAVTDHDTVAALPEAHACAGQRIRIIDGIELNTIWNNPDGNAQNVHILGYFIDPASAPLLEVIARQQAARLNYLNETLERLQSTGHVISANDVIAASGKGTIGRPHICAAMVKAGVAVDNPQAYHMLVDRDSPFYAVRRSISPQEAVSAIKAAGGLSSLAHPGKEPHIPALVKVLSMQGLNAIEAYHRGHTLHMVRKYLKLARRKNMLVTGGSDCHGSFADYPASIGSVRLSPEVVRRLEKAAGRGKRNVR